MLHVLYLVLYLGGVRRRNFEGPSAEPQEGAYEGLGGGAVATEGVRELQREEQHPHVGYDCTNPRPRGGGWGGSAGSGWE